MALLHEQSIFGIDNHGFCTMLALSNPGRNMIMATKAKKTAKSSSKARSAAKKTKVSATKSTKGSSKATKKTKAAVVAKKKKPQLKKAPLKAAKTTAKSKLAKPVKAKKAEPGKKKAPFAKVKPVPVAKAKPAKPTQLKVVANEKAKPASNKKPAIAPPKAVPPKKVVVREERVTRVKAEIKEPINVLDVYNIIPLQILPGDEPVYDTQLSNMGISPYQEQAGEEYMNDRQHEHFRKILGIWKRQLLEEMGRTVHHLQDEAANFPDPNDRATQEEEFSLELRARDRERKLIKKIEETLQKIDEGDYGFCDSCGVEIGIRRLEARPTANLCIDCKTLDEIRERQLGG